jgi:hypothetical protein
VDFLFALLLLVFAILAAEGVYDIDFTWLSIFAFHLPLFSPSCTIEQEMLRGPRIVWSGTFVIIRLI